MASNNKHLLSHSFYGSGSGVHFGWVALAQGLFKIAVKVLIRAEVSSEGSAEGGSAFMLVHVLLVDLGFSPAIGQRHEFLSKWTSLQGILYHSNL